SVVEAQSRSMATQTHPPPSKIRLRERVRRLAPALGLLFWALPCVAVSATLMAGHWVPLPVPQRDDATLRSALSDLLGRGDGAGIGSWGVVHVLYVRCRCSQRTFDYLFDRGASPGAVETILLVGAGDDEQTCALARRATASGFRVETTNRAELKARLNIESAPLLLIVDPAGEVAYSGGYTARKQGLDFRDQEYLAQLQAGKSIADLPAFGCGVSRELQST